MSRREATPSIKHPYMGTPLSVGVLMGNIACWGIVLGNAPPPNTAVASKVFVFLFLGLATLLLWSYRESYFEDRVVVRYLPFVSRQVQWAEVRWFSLHPILRLRTAEQTVSLPGTSPLLQAFIQNRLRAVPNQPEDCRHSSLTVLQLRYSLFWGFMFLACVLATSLFLDGFPLHRWWDSIGTVLLLCDLHLLFAAVTILGNTGLYYWTVRADER